jgi:hypothetical protein
MENESEFIELVGEMLNHPEMDMGYILKGFCDSCLEAMEKNADEDQARLWILLTKAQKLLKEE